jgi:hypothetical protein
MVSYRLLLPYCKNYEIIMLSIFASVASMFCKAGICELAEYVHIFVWFDKVET